MIVQAARPQRMSQCLYASFVSVPIGYMFRSRCHVMQRGLILRAVLFVDKEAGHLFQISQAWHLHFDAVPSGQRLEQHWRLLVDRI